MRKRQVLGEIRNRLLRPPDGQGKGHRLKDDELSKLYKICFIGGYSQYIAKEALGLHPATVKDWVERINTRLEKRPRRDGEDDAAYFRRNRRYALYRPKSDKTDRRTKLSDELVAFITDHYPTRPKMTVKAFYQKFFVDEPASAIERLGAENLPKVGTVYAAVRIVKGRKAIAAKAVATKKKQKLDRAGEPYPVLGLQ